MRYNGGPPKPYISQNARGSNIVMSPEYFLGEAVEICFVALYPAFPNSLLLDLSAAHSVCPAFSNAAYHANGMIHNYKIASPVQVRGLDRDTKSGSIVQP